MREAISAASTRYLKFGLDKRHTFELISIDFVKDGYSLFGIEQLHAFFCFRETINRCITSVQWSYEVTACYHKHVLNSRLNERDGVD